MSRNQVLLDKIEEALVQEYGQSLTDYGLSEEMAEAAYDVVEKYLDEHYR